MWDKHFFAAIRHARVAILTIALTYVASVTAGIAMTHWGNPFALNYRDRIVRRALAGDPSSRALRGGQRTRAALLDFRANLLIGAVPQTISGFAILPPYLLAAFRGWIGGIVSVDSTHQSRLRSPHERNYYLTVLILQLVPYSLTGGAGVHVGLAWFRRWRASAFRSQAALPDARAVLIDVLWIYALSIPLFLIASSFEFLAR